MRTSQKTVETADGAMPVYEAEPDGEARGGIVVIQEAFGVTSHIEDICRRLADAGWLAVAPALFHRSGSPVLSYDDYESVMPAMQALSTGSIAEDLRASFEHLEARGFGDSRCGIVGFCMGGSVTFYAATLRRLGGAVTFYGGGVAQGRFGFPPLVELAPKLQSPWLGLYGDLDKSIPVEDVERLREEASKAPVETEIVRYPDADHGFNCDDRPAVYNREAASDAWRRALAWFDAHVMAS
jgi:carboxymethylenebutenolidase